MNLTSFLWKFIRLQRFKFVAIALLSFVWTMDTTFTPYLLRLIVDTLTLHDADRFAAWDSLKYLLLIGVFFWTLMELGFRGRDFIMARALPELEANIRLAMFDHVQKHSPKYFNEHFSGALANKISDMISEVGELLRTLLIFFVPAFVTCIVTIVIFANINPMLAAILGIWIAAHLAICCIFTPRCAKYSHIHGEARSSLAGKIVDSLTNNFVVNLFFRFRFERNHVAAYQKIEQKKNVYAQVYTAKMFAWLSVVFLIEMFALIGCMILFWMREIISTGELVQVFYTVFNLTMVIWMTADAAPRFFQSLGIAKQALTVMNDASDIVDAPQAIDLVVRQGEILFENVSFQYESKQLFKNKSLRISGGEKVGLVGYSGAGKSSLVNLILRFYPIDKGRILIDGQDIAKVTLESLRRQTTLIPQDPLLFHRSLEENIRYGREDATFEECVQAAKFAHCDEFIRNCSAGYATVVGERGTKLSGGERQRIAIARAFLSRAPILLLDEATSALDSVTEKLIAESLEKLMQNRTTIVIAHRLSTLAKMDRILVFEQGKVVEEGSHEALVKKGGHYAHMWKMQAGGFLPGNA